jgi:hypothetical protein
VNLSRRNTISNIGIEFHPDRQRILLSEESLFKDPPQALVSNSFTFGVCRSTRKQQRGAPNSLPRYNLAEYYQLKTISYEMTPLLSNQSLRFDKIASVRYSQRAALSGGIS